MVHHSFIIIRNIHVDGYHGACHHFREGNSWYVCSVQLCTKYRLASLYQNIKEAGSLNVKDPLYTQGHSALFYRRKPLFTLTPELTNQPCNDCVIIVYEIIWYN